MPASAEIKFTITKTWDGEIPSDKSEINLTLSNSISPGSDPSIQNLVIYVDAPFYNDPHIPLNIPSGSTNNLWDYEVVEIFFLGEDNKYLEVELAPNDHYLLLQLDGCRNITRTGLPLQHYSTIIKQNGRWSGEALIPIKYFPTKVIKLNAYAIHKSDPNRVYMSLFPVPKNEFVGPDFHRLKYFQPINDLNKVLPHNS